MKEVHFIQILNTFEGRVEFVPTAPHDHRAPSNLSRIDVVFNIPLNANAAGFRYSCDCHSNPLFHCLANLVREASEAKPFDRNVKRVGENAEGDRFMLLQAAQTVFEESGDE